MWANMTRWADVTSQIHFSSPGGLGYPLVGRMGSGPDLVALRVSWR